MSLVARGIRFLTSSQDQSGVWRTYKSGQGGAEKAETMWGALGLVTVDVASLTVSGLTDGQHVEPKMTLGVSAADNQGAGIKQLEVLLDDSEPTYRVWRQANVHAGYGRTAGRKAHH